MIKSKYIHILIAAVATPYINNAYAWSSSVDDVFAEGSVDGFCARQGPGYYEDEYPCAICIPLSSNDISSEDDEVYDWINANYEQIADDCASPSCEFGSVLSEDFKNEPVSDNLIVLHGTSANDDYGYFYQCTPSGWVKQHDPCNDETFQNGTMADCCNPSTVTGYLTCTSYSRAYCNSGYYGTYNGGRGSCSPCPGSTYETAQLVDGKWQNTGDTVDVKSDTSNNKTITSCFIPKLGGSLAYVDNNGVYVFTEDCGWGA